MESLSTYTYIKADKLSRIGFFADTNIKLYHLQTFEDINKCQFWC